MHLMKNVFPYHLLNKNYCHPELLRGLIIILDDSTILHWKCVVSMSICWVNIGFLARIPPSHTLPHSSAFPNKPALLLDTLLKIDNFRDLSSLCSNYQNFIEETFQYHLFQITPLNISKFILDFFETKKILSVKSLSFNDL